MDLLKYARPIPTVDQAHAEAERQGAKCHECPLRGSRQGPVLGDIIPNAALAVIAEAPSKYEVEMGKVMVGPSGEELDRALAEGGLNRADVTVTDILLCRPDDDLTTFLEKQNRSHAKACAHATKNGLPMPKAPGNPIDCCRPRLEHDLALSNSPVLLAIGGKALQAMAHRYGVPYGTGGDHTGQVALATIKGQHGAPVTMPDGKILCSSLHPAFAMREKAYRYVVRNDIARAARIVSRGNKIDWTEPQFHLFPTSAEIQRICAKFIEHKATTKVTLDIETNSADMLTCEVRCVGLGAKFPGDKEETVIVIPLKWMDGRDYWPSYAELILVTQCIREVLDACDLIAQNGAFDTNVCQRTGLMSRDAILKPSVMKRWSDTMLAHHDTDANDLPHDLGFITRQFCEAPLWKKDVDHKAALGTARDADLYLYNGKDVTCTSRIWEQLDQRIQECGTQSQFETDSALAPVTREMTNLGLPIDEVYRGELSVRFNELTQKLEKSFQEIVGKPINVRSHPQLGDWLYGDLGYSPPLNPQGYEWEEGDGWSTSVQALLKVIDNGVDKNTSDAIDVLLQYRACETIRGRYIDKLKTRFNDDPILAEAGRAPAVFVGKEEIYPERPARSVIHPVFKLHVVPSGRWSCEPSVHNWPSRAWALDVDAEGKPAPTNVRRLGVAPPGHVMCGFDFEQIELRLYAVVADDKLVLQSFAEGLDPHTWNAAALFAEQPSQVRETYEQLKLLPKEKLKYIRTIAKRFVFLEAYGGEVGKLYSVMSSERDKATGERVFKDLTQKRVIEWHRRWHDAHPETRQWHERVARDVRQNGYVQALLDNRRRFFRGGVSKENAPPNHQIQGSSAAIANQAVLRIAEEIPFRCWSPWTGLCLQVHDQIVVIVPESRAEEACRIIEKCAYWEYKGMQFMGKAKASRDWARQD